MKRFLILGNGAAGMTASQKLRELNEDAEIVSVTCENIPAYAKIMLPDYIGGTRQREKLILHDDNYYKNSRIELLKDNSLEKIDATGKNVTLSGGGNIEFDKLLIAIGASQFIPHIPGLQNGIFYSLNTIYDADQIKATAKSGNRAIVVGGGLTGIETALALNRQGVKTTIIEMLQGLLCTTLDDTSTKVLADEISSLGIDVITRNSISEIAFDGQKGKATLLDGNIIDFDMLIISAGIRPNIKEASEAGIKCRNGILTGKFLETSAEDIYAAGDVCELSEIQQDGYATGYLWPNAMAQGKTAALNMSGQAKEFSFADVLYNPLQLRDVPFASAGLVRPETEDYEVLSKREKGLYKRIIVGQNQVKGIVSFGDMASFSKLFALFRNRTDINEMKERLLD